MASAGLKMVNPRAKGAIGENKVKEVLDDATGLVFERTPGSGNGAIKGDLHIPGYKNAFCIEVKNYAESPFNDKIFTSKTSNLVLWWEKLVKQSAGKKPLLIFKYNRSKLFVGTSIKPTKVKKYVEIAWLSCYIMLLDDWLKEEEIVWLHLPKS
jgi:hypothetical protein